MPRRAGPHEQVRLTADIVVLTIRDERLNVLLIERRYPPFQGQWALPGGFVAAGESVDRTALRELVEETGIDGEPLHLEQVRTYSDPERDPRSRVVTVAYLGIAPDLPEPCADTDAARAAWKPVDNVLDGQIPLAFDHLDIVGDAVERARGKLEYTSLATAFCRDPFTIADLRKVYEAVWGVQLDPGNFSRKVTRTERFIIATGELRTGETGRPPALYRRGDAVTLYPPMLRSGMAGAR